jgi:hypothetical protein
MTEQPIPFANKEGSGLSELGGGSPVAFNIVTDGVGAVHRRPGLQARAGVLSSAFAASAITGVWVTQAGTIYAVDSGSVRHIYKVSAAAANLSPDSPSIMLGTERPQFVETEALLVIACGDLLQKVELSTSASSRLGGDPPKASHLATNSARILCNDVVSKGYVHYSDQAAGTSIAGHELWTVGVGTAGFFSGEARPDNVVAIADNTNEVFLWGSTTLQVYAPDAQVVFAPVATRQIGISAAYSVIANDQSFAWLDDQRRFVSSDGRTIEVLSDPIAQTLDNLGTVSDCFGYRFNEGYADVLVWTFPTEGVTFAYQQGVGWCRWAGWNGNWTAFPVTSHQTSLQDNIVGTSDGKVLELANGANTDLGEPIRAYVETGRLSRGTGARKQCQGVYLKIQRGKTSSSTEPQGLLSWSDRPGYWENPIPVSFGSGGETTAVVSFRSLGVYRDRAWRFEFSGTDELILASATEAFTVLGD